MDNKCCNPWVSRVETTAPGTPGPNTRRVLSAAVLVTSAVYRAILASAPGFWLYRYREFHVVHLVVKHRYRVPRARYPSGTECYSYILVTDVVIPAKNLEYPGFLAKQDCTSQQSVHLYCCQCRFKFVFFFFGSRPPSPAGVSVVFPMMMLNAKFRPLDQRNRVLTFIFDNRYRTDWILPFCP